MIESNKISKKMQQVWNNVCTENMITRSPFPHNVGGNVNGAGCICQINGGEVRRVCWINWSLCIQRKLIIEKLKFCQKYV